MRNHIRERLWFTIFVSAVLSLFLAFTAFADYECNDVEDKNYHTIHGQWTADDADYTFTSDTGQQYVSHWLFAFSPDFPSDKESYWFYMDGNGHRLKNQFMDYNGKTYYLGENGGMKDGWFKVGNDIYYCNRGILKNKANASINGHTYSFDEKGRAKSLDGKYEDAVLKLLNRQDQRTNGNGWLLEGDEWTFWQNGVKLMNAWRQDNGNWYYMDENGYIVKDKVREINGSLYHFNYKGIMDSHGMTSYEGKKYMVRGDGHLQEVTLDQVITETRAIQNSAKNQYLDNQTVQWINATCAIYMLATDKNIKAFSGEIITEEKAAKIIKDRTVGPLTVQWGVTDRTSADRVLNRLIESGNATGSAWDYSRAVSNLGLYYRAGYYKETEALDKALEVAKIIQTRFDSWDSFNQSYLDGYNAWRSPDYMTTRESTLETLKNSVNNPFLIDWNLDLQKSW